MHDIPSVRSTPPDDNRVLKRIGGAVVVGAVVVVAWGIHARHHADQMLADWTKQQATPTVSVVTPQGGGRGRRAGAARQCAGAQQRPDLRAHQRLCPPVVRRYRRRR